MKIDLDKLINEADKYYNLNLENIKLYSDTCKAMEYLDLVSQKNYKLLEKADRILHAKLEFNRHRIASDNRKFVAEIYGIESSEVSNSEIEDFFSKLPHAETLEEEMVLVRDELYKIGIQVGKVIYDIAKSPTVREVKKCIEELPYGIGIIGDYSLAEHIRNLAEIVKKLEKNNDKII